MEGSGKKAVSLSIDADLVAEAREAGTDMSEVLEAALKQKLKTRRDDQWRRENDEAVRSMNAYIETHGLLSDRYRPD